ncbi:MAG: 50S ribosomal protein L21 [Oligoflexia bacterium]|nr:50S ribosomal protein L21 [Oligoflexia bacterium]
MYAVVRTGGKQYRVKPGDKFTVEKLSADGQKVNLEEVLLISEEGSEPMIGRPVIEGARVECELIAQAKSKKVMVFKFKRRKRYMRKKGHRQQLTMLKVRNISCGDKVWKAEGKK